MAGAGPLPAPATLFDPEPLTGPQGPVVRVRMTVAYHGAGFSGFAPSTGVRTVGGVLGHAIARVLGHPVELTCAGRTDKGVHGQGQVVSFDASATRLDPGALSVALNRLCRPEIAVRDVAVAAPGFDARFDARWRRYRYTVVVAETPDPFRAATAWLVPPPVDLAAMRLGADVFIGEHDFSSFCRRARRSDGSDAPLVRRVHDCRWVTVDDITLRLDIEANSFCHQMVRSIVGVLVDCGRGRRRAGELTGLLRARSRSHGATVAPPHGLCLWEVGYGD